ncbi:alpha/beta fold hydrolase [candidate division KSB1 bacterium]|nr:alpha/beta fold hydrolase [candidate division KSB1 bacterium]
MKKIYLVIIILFLFANIISGQQNSIKSGYIDVTDGKLYYETAGHGEKTIIFIHDGLVHGEVWNNQFPVFAEKFRVVRYDRRGYGRSPKPEKNYSNIDDLNQVFTSLKIDKAILIGMSAGGGLVIDFTLKHPDKVSSLIVVGAVVSGFGYSDHFRTRGGHLTASDYADPERLLQYFVKEDPYEIAPQNKQVKENLWELLLTFPQNIDLAKNRLAVPPERPALVSLNEIKVPALIVIGEYDIPDVFVHAGAIESGIPFAQKAIIPNAGHLVPLEQPEFFNQQVFNFFNGAEFFYTLNKQSVSEALEMFHKKRKEDSTWIPFSEARMNTLGYQYLQTGKTKEAIELFKLNVLAYPQSSNTYDSLGEAYMIDGDRESAIQNYKRSLELDPNNKNAVEKLEQLK